MHETESNPPGDIPDQQVYITYRPPGGHYSVRVPEGWSRTVGSSGDQGASVTFTDKLNAIVLVETSSSAAPTVGDLRSVVIPDLRAHVPQFALGTVSSVARRAGTALLVTYLGDSAPDPVTGKVIRTAFERYAFWHAGHQAVITLSGPQGADNVDPWRTITDSVAWA